MIFACNIGKRKYSFVVDPKTNNIQMFTQPIITKGGRIIKYWIDGISSKANLIVFDDDDMRYKNVVGGIGECFENESTWDWHDSDILENYDLEDLSNVILAFEKLFVHVRDLQNKKSYEVYRSEYNGSWYLYSRLDHLIISMRLYYDTKRKVHFVYAYDPITNLVITNHPDYTNFLPSSEKRRYEFLDKFIEIFNTSSMSYNNINDIETYNKHVLNHIFPDPFIYHENPNCPLAQIMKKYYAIDLYINLLHSTNTDNCKTNNINAYPILYKLTEYPERIFTICLDFNLNDMLYGIDAQIGIPDFSSLMRDLNEDHIPKYRTTKNCIPTHTSNAAINRLLQTKHLKYRYDSILNNNKNDSGISKDAPLLQLIEQLNKTSCINYIERTNQGYQVYALSDNNEPVMIGNYNFEGELC